MNLKTAFFVMLSLSVGYAVSSAQNNENFYKKHIDLSLGELMDIATVDSCETSSDGLNKDTIDSQAFYNANINLSLEELILLSNASSIELDQLSPCTKRFYEKHLQHSLEELMEIELKDI